MALTAVLPFTAQFNHSQALDLNTIVDSLVATWGTSLTNGTGANQGNVLWHDQRTLADGANETLDLGDGSLSHAFGTFTLSKLKGIMIYNGSSDASLLIGGAAANQLGLFADVSDKLTLPPGGLFVFTAPDATGVDTSVNADLKLEHNGTGTSTLTYKIAVWGVD